MKILVTGTAGFIGMHVAISLLKRGDEVIGIDNISDYYDIKLKNNRLEKIENYERFKFIKMDLCDNEKIKKLFSDHPFDCVVNLAAQPGVRYSLKNPHAYINSNITGLLNILEGCVATKVGHLVYASSSSVYGANTKMPFSVHHNVDHPVSLYAATKKSSELMAHTYSHLYNLPVTGLRFFTVYGPWGRPDMSPSLFASAISKNEPINVFNHGKMMRDFTYIDDIVEGVVRIIDKIPTPNNHFDLDNPDPASSYVPYRVYNIGNNEPVELMTFIETIESAMGKKAKLNYMEMQSGDVVATYADIADLYDAIEYKPTTALTKGINHFISWFKEYYN